jgi:UDP-GlcNAc:undecaprenyl-phosphate GlcNAc-1-phosphate transferase
MTRISLWIAKKLEIIDYPGRTAHNIHRKPIPRAGGIAILLSLSVLVIANRLWSYPEVIKILLPSLMVFAFGLWDDKHGMKALIKLFGQLLAVTVLVLFDVRVEFLEKPGFFIHLDSNLAYWADICITYFWVIGLTNAFNIVDSIDGLGIGLTQIYSAFFLFLSMISNQVSLIYISAIIFGISWGVSFYNRRPAKIFLGDSGDQVLGFILAATAIIYSPITDIQSSSWFT